MDVENLLKDIENRDLVLPEFQRGFVWKEKDLKTYIQSLYKRYPTGSLLIWKTTRPPKLRGEQKIQDDSSTRVLLDGQQRLTTLYFFIKGKIPPYYKKGGGYEEKFNKFNLYFNVETEEFRYHQKSLMKDKKEWISVRKFFESGSAASFIQESEHRNYYFEYLDQLTKLEKIKNYNYYVDDEKLSKISNIKEVVKIFNLVNKAGRTLQEEDLALAHICIFWPEVKELFRQEIKLLLERGFAFNFNFLILCLNCVATGHAKFDNLYTTPEEKVKTSWEKTKQGLESLVNILHDKAYVNSTNQYELKSDALLVPLVTYLSKNNGEFKDEVELKKALYWFYMAMIWGRYTRRGKSSPLEQDIVSITKENNIDCLINNLKREVRNLEVKAEDLEGSPITSPFFNMTFIVAKSKGAIDWFNGNNLHPHLLGKLYKLHKHHIFPKDQLEKMGYEQKKRNELANRAYLTAKANLKASNSKPEVYLPKAKEKYPDALKQQFVTDKEELYKLENYEDFLEDRRRRITKEINNFLNKLLEKESLELDIKNLIQSEESYNLEFKSTFGWNIRENKLDKDMRQSILKTIVSFMNSNGGTLVIGVDDNKNIIGMEYDYKSNWKGNKDGFLLEFSQFIEKAIGLNNYAKYINVKFCNFDNKELCVVQVEKSFKPIFIKKEGKKTFYVRIENRTEPLEDPEKISEFIGEV